MTLVKAVWIGGPADGDSMLVNDTALAERMLVLSGTKDNVEKRLVTPRHMSDGSWILPFYEGQIVEVEETSD
jgi:hypothetical protein